VQESFGAKTSALKPLQVFGQRVFRPVMEGDLTGGYGPPHSQDTLRRELKAE
jgi:hypothetical protein